MRLGAGASSGRDEEPVRGSRPVHVPEGGPGWKGRAVGADSAATQPFTLPVAPEFLIGTADYAGRRT